MDMLPIVHKTYEVYKAIVLANDKMPKRWKYNLGISLEDEILDFLKHLVMAQQAPRQFKGSYLLKASASLEVVRFKVRLLLELGLVNETKIFQFQAIIAEIGRMLGGWLKSLGGL